MKRLLGLLLISAITAHVIQTKIDPPDPAVCASVPESEKYDCYPESPFTSEGCTARGCCVGATKDVSACFYPPGFKGYKTLNSSTGENRMDVYLEREVSSPYPGDVSPLKLEVEYQTDTRIRVKIYDPNTMRFESPYPKIEPTQAKATKARLYDVKIDENSSGFQVVRSNGDVIFDGIGKGSFIFADQFIQLSAKILGHLYGLGEHRTSLMLPDTWSKYSFLNRDRVPGENANLYGTHPFYLAVEPSGQSHGVFLKNSDPLEVTVQPGPGLTYRALGGIIDLYFFLGPTPSDVISQYTELIGRPFMPPYWGLGFQMCRFGYQNIETLKATFQRTIDAGIPYDVQWVDIDAMVDNTDFTYDSNRFADLPDFVKQLHDLGMHFVPIVDPGISGTEPAGKYPAWDLGIEKNVFVKDENGDIFVGKVWNPTSTVWPDFFHPNATSYWTSVLQAYHDTLPFDAIWIDMNEPSNFLDGTVNGCPDNKYNHPPYTPSVEGGIIYSKTICMSAQQSGYLHYDVHNLYSISEAEVTQAAITEVLKKRSFVISRSTFAGSGKYTGHWSGDNASNWYDLWKSIQEILTFNLYGIPFIGADICGFAGDTTPALCSRWMQLGAFYPFSRNHNMGREQDPAILGDEVVASAKKSLTTRYTLLPFLYTLLYKAHVNGETVARPLFFEFVEDMNTHSVDKSFLWGPSLLIVPVLEEDAVKVTTYLPAGVWYNYYTHELIESSGEERELDAPLDTIPLLLRGGYIIPTQHPDVTTTLSRANGFSLLVVNDTATGQAQGSLFWDDGETLDTIENGEHLYVEFSLDGVQLQSKVIQSNADIPVLDSVILIGATRVSNVNFNGVNVRFTYNENTKTLVAFGLKGNLKENFTLTFG